MPALVSYARLNHESYAYTFCVLKWGDETKKFARTKWNQLAQDKVNWRSLAEAFVLQWTQNRLMMMRATKLCLYELFAEKTMLPLA